MRGWREAALPTVKAAPEAPAQHGMVLYATQCATCHQSGGAGLEGHFPPLAKDSVVNAKDPTEMTKSVLYGVSGRAINGQNYAVAMPPFAASLTNKEIADVETYIRTSFGNNAPPVPTSHVRLVKRTHANGGVPPKPTIIVEPMKHPNGH
jgi:mono/diheme cytochrome c family protein